MCILCRWAHIGGLIKILYILIQHSLLLTNYSCKYITRTSNVDPMSGLYWSDDSSAIIWYLLRAILKRGFYCRADLCTAHTVILAVTVACYAHWDGIDKIASKIIVCICSQFYWFGNFLSQCYDLDVALSIFINEKERFDTFEMIWLSIYLLLRVDSELVFC